MSGLPPLIDRGTSRILFLAVLLLTEILAIAFYFDIHNIALRGEGWSQWLDSAHLLFRFAFSFVCVWALIETPHWKTAYALLLRHGENNHWRTWLLLHLLAFAGLAALNLRLEIAEASPASNDKAPWLVFAWLITVAAFLLLWLRVLAPMPVWLCLLWKRRNALMISTSMAGVIGIGSWLTQSLWRSFNHMTFRTVQLLLELRYPLVIADTDEFVLGPPEFSVEIDKACSGYEGMGLVTLFLALYLRVFRHELRFPQALLLFPIGLASAWFLNTLRIAVLIAIGASWSEDIAMNGFHSQAGWLSFLLVAFGLMWAAGRWTFITQRDAKKTAPIQEKHGDLATALLLPFIVLMAAMLLTSAFSDSRGDTMYPLKIMATGCTLWVCRRAYRIYQWRGSWDASLIGAAVFTVWLLLEPASDTDAHPTWLDDLPTGHATVWLLFRALGSVLIVPLTEEFLFRGYLLPKLVSSQFETVDSRRFTWLSFLGSSLLFGLLHQRWLAGSLAGMAFAYAQYRHGRLADAVLAHVIANALIAVAVLGFGQWQLWS